MTLAAVLLGETLAPVQVAGGIAILGAALLLQRGTTEAGDLGPAAVPAPDAVASAEQG